MGFEHRSRARNSFLTGLVIVLLCGCSQTGITPLSACPQPYLEQHIDSLQGKILKDVSSRATEACASRLHGCSISAPRKTRQGYRVAVFPVAEQANGQCGYASDTQTYYHYDASGRFLFEREGAP